jgi:hypothetical protein
LEIVVVDRSKFKGPKGDYITQGLFIDFNYNDKYAVYCLSDTDKDYNGVTYPSLRRLYLEMQDVTEYEFATTHLHGWEHWQRILGNAILREHVEKWREELELKMQAVAVKAMLSKAAQGDFNAAKWLAAKGWLGQRGRPSKAELEKERRQREKLAAETKDDSARILSLVKKD